MMIKTGSVIQLTSDVTYVKKCTNKIIYVDDVSTLTKIEVGMEVVLNCGQIVTTCTNVIDAENIMCTVVVGGNLEPYSYVSIRGLKHARHPLSGKDETLIQFAKEFHVTFLIFYQSIL